MIGVSRTTLWRMVQAGTFPRPVHITERNRGYLRAAVEAWMKARADGLPLAPAAPAVELGRRGKRASLVSMRAAERRAE
jgi:sugar (pentulose or hexulose) kinase